MKHIRFGYVDVVTGVPCSETEPMRNGGAMPDGAVFGFALESQYPCPCPTFYGLTDSDTLPVGAVEVTEAEYNEAYQYEMTARFKNKVKYVYESSVDAHIDSKAKELGYESTLTASSYTGVDNPFRKESEKFVAWKAAVWIKCYELLSQYTPNDELPSVDEIIDQLPEF